MIFSVAVFVIWYCRFVEGFCCFDVNVVCVSVMLWFWFGLFVLALVVLCLVVCDLVRWCLPWLLFWYCVGFCVGNDSVFVVLFIVWYWLLLAWFVYLVWLFGVWGGCFCVIFVVLLFWFDWLLFGWLGIWCWFGLYICFDYLSFGIWFIMADVLIFTV